MSIAAKFSKNLFWDVDETSLDQDLHARFIIERVLSRGIFDDWQSLIAVYGLARIKKESIKIRNLDKLTLSFCSSIFKVPKSRFRCYKQPQSIQQLWPY
jgi:hypothetical protein